ncbi:MAG TPA: c-type cytochrome biogenesis protein CcmI [Burkholderiales bacterium]|nr:c-type cytochrome biogenesis protein CcmI [Burkholderiales bacterium]
MIAFALTAVALTAAAVAIVLRPLLRRRAPRENSRAALNVAVYRDQLRELKTDLDAGTLSREQYDTAQREIEARLLQDVHAQATAPAPARAPRAAIAATVAIPLCALALYLTTGNPGALVPQAAQAPHSVTPQQIEAMVERLAQRMREKPDDVVGWTMLGRSYAVLERFGDSAAAYAKAVALEPRNAQLLADYADVLAMTHGQRLSGEPEKFIMRALEADPRNLKALALAASVAFEKQDYTGAVGYYQQMLPLVERDSDDARAIEGSMDEARSLAGVAKGKPAPATTARAAAAVAPARDEAKSAPARDEARSAPARDEAKSAPGVRGVARLAPALAGKVAPDDVVFIFARAASGPPMPLAVLRKRVRELPVTFTLDDSMAMAPTMKLSGFQSVVVGARISKRGNAAPQPGDLQGLSAPVRNDAAGVEIVIDTELR